MCKKFISYLLIFSIFYSDAAWCGVSWSSGEEHTYLKTKSSSSGSPKSGSPEKKINTGTSLSLEEWHDMENGQSISEDSLLATGSTNGVAKDYSKTSRSRTNNSSDGLFASDNDKVNFDGYATSSDEERDQLDGAFNNSFNNLLFNSGGASGRVSPLPEDDGTGQEGDSVPASQQESRDGSIHFKKDNGKRARLDRITEQRDGSLEVQYCNDSTGVCVVIGEKKLPELIPAWCHELVGAAAPQKTEDKEEVQGDRHEENVQELSPEESTSSGESISASSQEPEDISVANPGLQVANLNDSEDEATNGQAMMTEEPVDSMQAAIIPESAEDGGDTVVAIHPKGKTKLVALLEGLSPEARNTLRDLVGWEKWPAMLVGAGIGGMAAKGMGDVFAQGIIHIGTEYWYGAFSILKGGYLRGWVIGTSAVDSVIRNTLYGKKALSSLSQKNEREWPYIVRVAGISFLPSLVAPFALISVDLEWLDLGGYLDSDMINDMGIFSLPLYFDSWAFNIDMTSQIWPDVKKWYDQLDIRAVCWGAKPSSPLLLPVEEESASVEEKAPVSSEEEVYRTDFRTKLKALARALPLMTDDQVFDIYDTLVNAKETIQNEPILQELDPENLEAGQSFLTMYYLLSWGEGIENTTHGEKKASDSSQPQTSEVSVETLCDIVNDAVQSVTPSSPLLCEEEKAAQGFFQRPPYVIYEDVMDLLTKFSIGLGSGASLVTLKFIVHDMLYIMGDALWTVIHTSFGVALETEGWGPVLVTVLAWGVAVCIGFPAQTMLEYEGMKKFTSMLWSEDYEGHESHPWLRRSIKLVCLAQGVLLTSIVGVLGLQATTAEWGEDWLDNPDGIAQKWFMLASIISHMIPEWAVLATCWEDTFNRKVLSTGIDAYEDAPYIYNTYIHSWWNKYIREASLRPLVPPSRAVQQDRVIRIVRDYEAKIDYAHPEALIKWDQLLKTKND